MSSGNSAPFSLMSSTASPVVKRYGIRLQPELWST
jgi:hypothetical protein